jgi:hypothetical protein
MMVLMIGFYAIDASARGSSSCETLVSPQFDAGASSWHLIKIAVPVPSQPNEYFLEIHISGRAFGFLRTAILSNPPGFKRLGFTMSTDGSVLRIPSDHLLNKNVDDVYREHGLSENEGYRVQFVDGSGVTGVFDFARPRLHGLMGIVQRGTNPDGHGSMFEHDLQDHTLIHLTAPAELRALVERQTTLILRLHEHGELPERFINRQMILAMDRINSLLEDFALDPTGSVLHSLEKNPGLKRAFERLVHSGFDINVWTNEFYRAMAKDPRDFLGTRDPMAKAAVEAAIQAEVAVLPPLPPTLVHLDARTATKELWLKMLRNAKVLYGAQGSR